MTDEPKVARPSHLNDNDEGGIVERLKQMLQRAKAAREKVAGHDNSTWETLWDFYRGGENQWKGYPGSLTGYQQLTYNRIGRNIEIAEALLDEMHISAEVQPTEPNDEVAAALLDVGKNVIMSREYNTNAVGLTSRYARICGSGAMKVWWDQSLHDGLGDVRWQMWPIEDFYMDPDALDLDTAKYIITKTRMDKAEAESKYGVTELDTAPPKEKELGERVESGNSYERVTTNEVGTDGSALSTSTYLMPGAAFFSTGEHAKEVEVLEAWVRDDPKQWPNGRHIITIGKKVVIDEDQDYNHGKWPFAFMVDQADPKSAYGDTSSRQAIEMQRDLNLMISLISLATHLNVASAWVNFPQSGIPNSMLQKYGAKATSVFLCRHPAFMPQRMQVGQINPRLFDFMQMLIENIDKAQRIQDVIPPGARGFPASGEVVRELRETQLVEIRQKAANKARFMKRVVELTIALMQQFYATDRWVRVMGPFPQALEGLVDESLIVQGDKSGEGGWVKMNADNLRHQWDVQVVESTWEPLSKEAQNNRLGKMAERDQYNTIGVADLVELEQGGVQIQRLKRRVRQKQQAMEKAAAAQAQQGMPPEGAPPQGAM